MVSKGAKSTMIRSYLSAIKAVLKDDEYQWDDNKVILDSLIKGCRLINDKVKTRLPIHVKLLELMLFEIARIYGTQPFLKILYQTILSMGYYGMFRISELVRGCEHFMRAHNVNVAHNREKILVILYTSKTNGKESRSQKIKITSNSQSLDMSKNSICKGNRFFCPFTLVREYMRHRGGYVSEEEPFFIFSDGSPVWDHHLRKISGSESFTRWLVQFNV